MRSYRRDAQNQLRYGRFVLTTSKDAAASRRRATRYRSASYTPESSADHASGGLSTAGALTLPRMHREDSAADGAEGEEPCKLRTCRGRRGCLCPRTRCCSCGDDCGRRLYALSAELCKKCERRLEAPQAPSLRSFFDLSVLDVTADEFASLSSWSIYTATNVLQLELQKRQLRRAEVSEGRRSVEGSSLARRQRLAAASASRAIHHCTHAHTLGLTPATVRHPPDASSSTPSS